MLQQIKDLMTMKAEISALSLKFAEHTKQAQELSAIISDLRKEVLELKKTSSELSQQFVTDSHHIKSAKEEFLSEISDFKLVKSRLEKKIVDSFEEELKEHIFPKYEKLEKEIAQFAQLGAKSSALIQQFSAISAEVQKLITISSRLKAEDFELKKFAQQLLETDKEKLELMRKIDTLERLVGKIRRGSNQGR